jgi:hypothetical protein
MGEGLLPGGVLRSAVERGLGACSRDRRRPPRGEEQNRERKNPNKKRRGAEIGDVVNMHFKFIF